MRHQNRIKFQKQKSTDYMIKNVKNWSDNQFEIKSVSAYINGVKETFYNVENDIENREYNIM